MFKSFLLSALRNLLRHKVQSLINIASLALGLTVFGFAFLYVKRELSFDRSWPEGERVHRLVVEQRGIPGLVDGIYTSAPADVWPLLKENFSTDIDKASRVAQGGARPVDGETNILPSLWFVDPDFTDIFQLELIDGDIERVLSGPGFIALEQTMAERFGMLDRVGERVAFKSFYDGELEFELAAIYRLPQPVSSAAAPGMFTLLHDYVVPLLSRGEQRYVPWESASQIWVKLKPGVDTEKFNAGQSAFVQENIRTYDPALGPQRKISDHLLYRWQALPDIHLNPVASADGSAGDLARIATFAIVGLLVLLVGCSNSVSLSLAAALERRSEIGVRKAAGALQHEIMVQQLGESILLALLALIPALILLELVLPVFQALLFVRVETTWTDYALLAVIAAAVGSACGAYPAIVLASTRPQAVLRAGAQQGSKAGFGLRNLLVTMQFCFASILLIATSALYLQIAFARAQPLGFDADNLLFVFFGNQSASAEVLRTEVEKVPGVTRAIRGFNPPGLDIPLTMNMTTLVRSASDSVEVKAQSVIGDFGFNEMMGMRLLAGRNFDARIDSVDVQTKVFADGSPQQERRNLLNATAVRDLGYASPEDALNQTVYMRVLPMNDGKREIQHMPFQIIGVVEDNLYASVRRRPGPEIYIAMPSTTASGNLMLKYDDGVETSIQQSIREVGERVNGSPPLNMMFAETQIGAAFQREKNESKLLLICGGLALLLASFGLYGLAAFAITRQVKEVGVRKVMGADVSAIVGLYLWRFAKPILLANIVAWPAAIYFVLQWIERFPYQMERAWLAPLCIGALAVVLLIAMLTVSVITTRAASANPLRSLRYE